jgi:hypothetical protein
MLSSIAPRASFTIAWLAGTYLSVSLPTNVYADSAPVALTAEYLLQSYDAANVEPMAWTESFARQSTGSHVRFRRHKDGTPFGVKRIVDLTRRKSVTVDPRTQSLVTYNLEANEVAFWASPAESCAPTPGLTPDPQPQAKILGFDVVLFTGKLQGSDDPVRRWYAPALNCLVVQEEVITPGFRNVRTASSIVLGEPDPALFVLPQGYIERSPVEVLALAKEKTPSMKANPKPAADFDSVYRNRNSNP